MRNAVSLSGERDVKGVVLLGDARLAEELDCKRWRQVNV